jgi:phosphoribosylaminoimidazole carboxylase (NCAIR synthetase)
MLVLSTDNFALAREPEEVQAALEEALMAAQRQSGIARKLEVLRFEKKLLINKKTLPRCGTKKPHFRAIATVARALGRLQKLTGNSLT